MLTIYPSNRIEALSTVLGTLIAERPQAGPFQEVQVVVGSQGIQHWFNMQFAESQGIAMNIGYPLVTKFLWNMMRLVDPTIPRQSPYAREVLMWSIHGMLDRVKDDPGFSEPSNYWVGQSNSSTKRIQLARNLADLFEMYLIYRPDWIAEWDLGRADNWQGRLWGMLVAELGPHPVRYMQQCIENIEQGQGKFPKDIYVFGLSTLAPIYWTLFSRIAEYSEVHLFVLSPSHGYWGGAESDRQAIAKSATKVRAGKSAAETGDRENQLLTSCGRQGQEFQNMMIETPCNDVPVYIAPGQDTLLSRIQDDMLEMSRGTPGVECDDSIVVAATHSAIREVEVLHDYLLDLFQRNPNLEPRDVVVMAPEIEKYAPYVQSIFKDGPVCNRIPVSIADRAQSDAEPIAQSFLELLELPESRFGVTSVLGYLDIPAVRRRFDLTIDDVAVIRQWVGRVGIHWGVSAKHKGHINGVSTGAFTWRQGIRRLLSGIAHEQRSVIAGELVEPISDNDEALVLGRLAHFLEVLRSEADKLRKGRSVADWLLTLRGMLDAVYLPGQEDVEGLESVEAAIEALGIHTDRAGFGEELTLASVQDVMRHYLSEPIRKQQYMTGQVTFCSLVPMRAVPFKVVCILGMNDGDFPRRRVPLAFDMLASDGHRRGDRSLRADDRYMFLEAVLSARESLYVSYQNRSVKDNSERQPSLVLREFMANLEKNYGWNKELVRTHALQPFSAEAFSGEGSFGSQWVGLRHRVDDRDNRVLVEDSAPPVESTVGQWVQAFDQPARFFARNVLGLALDLNVEEISDSEPFIANHLDRYNVQKDLVAAMRAGGDLKAVTEWHELSNTMPRTPTQELTYAQWEEQATEYGQQVAAASEGFESIIYTAAIGGHSLQCEVLASESDEVRIVGGRLADAKPKDQLTLWLNHLVVSVATKRPVTSVGFFRAPDAVEMTLLTINPVTDPESILAEWLEWLSAIYREPRLETAALMTHWSNKKAWGGSDFPKYWADDFNGRGPAFDPFHSWFWPTMPSWTPDETGLVEGLYRHMQESIECEVIG